MSDNKKRKAYFKSCRMCKCNTSTIISELDVIIRECDACHYRWSYKPEFYNNYK